MEHSSCGCPIPPPNYLDLPCCSQQQTTTTSWLGDLTRKDVRVPFSCTPVEQTSITTPLCYKPETVQYPAYTCSESKQTPPPPPAPPPPPQICACSEPVPEPKPVKCPCTCPSYPPSLPPETSPQIPNYPQTPTQYTPSQSKSPNVGAPCIEDSTRRALSTGTNKSHAPDDIGWLGNPSQIASSWPKWDGVPFNTCGKTTNEICKFVFPSVNTMRGLRDLFYSTKPFADNVHPTIAEIDNWNVKVIQHFRNLIGAKMTVSPDKCLFLRAQWSNEKGHTRVWDTASYPGSCYGSTNAHCGSTFMPSCPDQILYLGNPPSPCCVQTGNTAEGIFTVNKDLPWSIKMSRVIATTLCSEGLSGHTGPFLGRQFVGLAFTCQGDSNIVRAKWSGSLQGIDCP